MKVPVYEQQVALRPQAAPAPANLRPVDSRASAIMQEGAAAFGRGLSSLGAAVDKQFEQEKAEAAKLAENDAILRYEKKADARLLGDRSERGKIDAAFDGRDTEGFLSKRGTDADKEAAKVLAGLEADVAEIANTIADPKAREAATLRLRERALGYRRRVESHAADEYQKAKMDVAEQRAARVVDGAANGTLVDEELAKAVVELHADLRGMFPKEQADELHKKTRDAVGRAYVDRLLKADDLVGAADFLESSKGGMSAGTYKELAGALEKKKDERLHAMRMNEARQALAPVVDAAKGKDGWLDTDAMEASVQDRLAELRAKADESGDEGDKAKLEAFEASWSATAKRAAHTNKALQAQARNRAHQFAVDGLPLDKSTRQFLYDHDADFLLAWDATAKKARKLRSGAARVSKEAQRAADDEVLAWYKAAVTTDPTVDPRTFAVEWTAANPDRPVVSDTTIADMAKEFSIRNERAQDEATSASEKARAKFADRMRMEASKHLRGLGIKDEVEVNVAVGGGLTAYDNAVKAKKDGAPLTDDEVAKVVSDMLTKQKDGGFFAPKRYGYELVKPTMGPAPQRTDPRGPPQPLTPRERQALEWLRDNPTHPDAPAVAARLKRRKK